MNTPLTYEPIGIVHTDHHDPGRTPIQGRLNRTGAGTVTIHPAFVAGLEGLDGFDYAWLVTHLHEPAPGARDAGDPLRPVPFLAESAEPVGVFATRYPVRPNPIGLSLIEIVAVDGSTISFRGVDLVDQTPVLDIKPWVPAFDLPHPDRGDGFAGVRTGWYEHSRLAAVENSNDTTITPRDLRGGP